jgi:hypothetical protein
MQMFYEPRGIMRKTRGKIVQLFINAVRIASFKRLGCAVVKTAKKPRRLLRSVLRFLKPKGKNIQIKKEKASLFSWPGLRLDFHSSASYIMTEEAYFPLN